MRFCYAAALSALLLCSAGPSGPGIGEAQAAAPPSAAKAILKAMSQYLGAQTDLSFKFDSTVEVVTPEFEKVAFGSSGSVRMTRPDKLRVERTGGFSDVEFIDDGKMLTVFGRRVNAYATAPVLAKSIDELLDKLRDEHDVQAPGADFLFSDVYAQLVDPLIDGRDLGPGIIGGVKCEHLAFRTRQVDWQIWVRTDGDPLPCRYVVTSKLVAQAPQYVVDFSDWRTGTAAAPDDYSFNNTTSATKLPSLGGLRDFDELPLSAPDEEDTP